VCSSRPGLGCPSAPLPSLANKIYAVPDVFFDLEVPEADDDPPGLLELCIYAGVPSPVSVDLLIPEFSGLPPVVVRVPMPERAVHENGHLSTDPSEIRTSGDRSGVQSPAAQSRRPKGAAKE
jgi:hypothetical protein